jgi:hypothetical protein
VLISVAPHCEHRSSVNGRVAGPALRAVDEEAVRLIVLGVQQDRPAVAALKINGVRAGDENRWRIHCVFEASGFDDPQFSRWILHDLPVYLIWRPQFRKQDRKKATLRFRGRGRRRWFIRRD